MSAQHVKYLLIGGGLASSTAAQAIRRVDPQGSLMIVGQEKVRPYHRPPLSKAYLRQRTDKSDLFALPVDWYTEHDAHLHTGLRAAHLDVARRVVMLDNGQEIAFDALLLATGASAVHLNIPGADLPNVFALRTLEDADRLHHAIGKARLDGAKHDRGRDGGRGRVGIIGGGVLGVELAGTLTQLGLAIDLVISGAHPWRKFAGEHTGSFLSRYLEARGVQIHANRRPVRLEGDGRVQRIALDDGSTIPCDFVITAVGASANRDLLRATPINAEKAILVDDHCRTNINGIFAAGDCCAVFDPLFGKHRVLDHWDNATITGAIAGTNMAGGEVRYDVVNHFFSDVFDLTLLGWGEARQVDHRLIRGNTLRQSSGQALRLDSGQASIESPDFIEFGIAADGRIAQVLAINHTAESDLLRDLVAKRVRVEGNEESLKDPAFPLASLL